MRTIKKRQDFLALRRVKGKPTPGFLLLGRARNDADGARFGFTVTKKNGNAVVRNRIRRRLKAAARECGGAAMPGWDYVLVARPRALSRKYADLLDDMKRALLSLPRTHK